MAIRQKKWKCYAKCIMRKNVSRSRSGKLKIEIIIVHFLLLIQLAFLFYLTFIKLEKSTSPQKSVYIEHVLYCTYKENIILIIRYRCYKVLVILDLLFIIIIVIINAHLQLPRHNNTSPGSRYAET